MPSTERNPEACATTTANMPNPTGQSLAHCGRSVMTPSQTQSCGGRSSSLLMTARPSSYNDVHIRVTLLIILLIIILITMITMTMCVYIYIYIVIYIYIYAHLWLYYIILVHQSSRRAEFRQQSWKLQGSDPEPIIVFEGWHFPVQRGARESLDPGILTA